ncbi:MAG: hypothetical protein LBD06_07195, partial [Candidatus Accumulibacter sp.]|nr:hypothetical protein [Accumulibacter sp.]
MSFTSVINTDEKACRSRATSFSHLDREARCYLEETMVYGLLRSEFFGIFRIPDGAVGIRLNHIPWND